VKCYSYANMAGTEGKLFIRQNQQESEGECKVKEVRNQAGDNNVEKRNVQQTEKDELFNRVENPYRITEPQMNAISSMDCTGSVPLGPDSEKELEAYLDVYQFESQSCPARGNFTGAANQESEGMKKLMGIPVTNKAQHPVE